MNKTSRQLSRREMLAGSLKFAGAAALAGAAASGTVTKAAGGYAPRLTEASYIWIQHFAAEKQTLAEGEAQAIAQTQQAGFRRIELMTEFFRADVRNQTRDLLAKFHLLPESVYANTTMHEAAAAETSIQDVLEVSKFLKPLGTRTIITDPSPKPHQGTKTDDELKTQAHYVEQLGAALHREGMKLLLHHHTPELRYNAREWRYELDHTDPKIVGCCVDVHWAFRGGEEVMPFLKSVGTRLEDVHLRNSQHGVWMEDFGPGEVDYAPVADYLHQINYRGLLCIELAYEKGTNPTRPLLEDLRRSRIYTEKVFGLAPNS